MRRCVVGCILASSQATARAQSLLGAALLVALVGITVVRMAGGQGLRSVLVLQTVFPLVLLISAAGIEPGVTLAGGSLASSIGASTGCNAVAHLTMLRIGGCQTLPNVTWTWITYVSWKSAWMRIRVRVSKLTQFSQPVCHWPVRKKVKWPSELGQQRVLLGSSQNKCL